MENEIKVNEYARDDFGNLFVVIGKYERGQFGEICVQLGDFKTKEFAGEQWERHLKIGNIIDLIKVGDVLRIKVQFHHETEPYYTLTEIQSKEDVTWKNILEQIDLCHYEVIEIYTKEMMESISYKVTKM